MKKTVEFISEICIIANRTIVFEGIEEQYQVDIVKAFPYEKNIYSGIFLFKASRYWDFKGF